MPIQNAMPANPAPPTDDYPQHIADAARAFLADGWEAGASALAPVAGLVWTEVIKRPAVRAIRTTDPSAAAGRAFTVKRAATTYRRDRFHCRYCGGKVLPVAFMSLVSLLYPNAVPYVSTYRRGAIHPAYWTRGAEADHIEPGSVGGEWLDPDNHATACARCNTKKSRYTLDELDWTLLPAPNTTWDGLLSLYGPVWLAAGSPNERYHRQWIAALSELRP